MTSAWLNFLTALGTVIGIAGFIYSVIVARRSERRKLLAYEVSRPFPLATVLTDQTEHRLTIYYEREGAPPVNVNGAYLHIVQVANFGKEPIRREDLAPSDLLRLEVSDARVLDLAVAGVSRNVINFKTGSVEPSGEVIAASLLSFDFLDYRDGAVIRVLTDSGLARIRVIGSIIGMPQGVHRKDEIDSNPILNGTGCGLAVLLQLSAIAGALYVFRTFTGGWNLLWIFLLPVAALFLPAGLVSLVVTFIWPKGPQWPQSLTLPVEAILRRAGRHLYPVEELEMLERERYLADEMFQRSVRSERLRREQELRENRSSQKSQGDS